MPSINLDDLTLAELKQLQKDLTKTIAKFDTRKRSEALSALEAKAQELGFSLADLTGAKSPRTRSSAAPKYRHPENPEITWSGRGRKPRWFQDAIDGRKTAEAMEV
jgi:DNA-binding protein H-NS